MSVLSALFLLGAVSADPLSVSGTVTDERGNPIPGARVFLEPGLALKLVEGTVGANGAFQFSNLRPGLVGIVGLADGYAISGASVEVGIDEPVTGVEVRLGSPQSVSAKVVNPRGQPIENAMLVGVLLEGDNPVGIPIRKLDEYGVATPKTGASGEFQFDRAPSGSLSLKIAHPEYAQETVSEVQSGSAAPNITLDPGVLVQGTVRARGSQLPVGRAALLVADADRSTAVVVTDNRGEFAIKLSPGRYACQASSAQFRSPGWETMVVTGQQIVQEVTLYVAGTGSVRGRVRDASSGNPIPNVQLALDAFDNTVDLSTTGSNGGFALQASEGPNVLRVVEAPGYRTDGIVSMKLDVKHGQTIEVPDVWLAKIPPFSLQVVDETGAPVSGAVVTMLNPKQYRWRQSRADGSVQVDVVNLPSSGRIVGLVEHPTKHQGAVFALDVTAGGPGKVQLFDFASVRGSIFNADGKALPGVIVGGAFQQDDTSEPVMLWQTVSRGGGTFSWDAVVPHLALVCLAADPAGEFSNSIPFNLTPGSGRDIGRIVLESGERAESMRGEKVDWRKFNTVSGPELPADFAGPAVIVFADAAEAAAVLDALETADQILSDPSVKMVLAITGSVSLTSSNVTILRGLERSVANGYLVDASGKVVLETKGIPPYSAIRRLAAGYTFE